MSIAQTTIVDSEGNLTTDAFTLRYKVLGEIGEGSYSKVLKCRNRESGEIYACKRLKHVYRSWTQVSEIPEIVTLRKLIKHENVLQMSEVHFDPIQGRVSLVFELMDMNLYELIKDRKRLLHESRVRNMIYQLVRGLRHLHKHGIFHRDVKPENILLKRMPNEDDEILKLGDLGSVRGLYSRPPYTEYISTRWYRSPECLLTAGFYSIKMDIWATGCVFYEVLTLRPLFPGSSEVDQVNRIHNILGPPPQKVLEKFVKHVEESRIQSHRHHKQARYEKIKDMLNDLSNGNGKSSNFEWYFSSKDGGKGVERFLPPHISDDAKDLLSSFLQYDPELRPTAHRALSHSYFKGLREAGRKFFEASNEVIVSIGHEIKTLQEIDGSGPDLRTLGDCKPKLRPVREVPCKIPMLQKLTPPFPKVQNAKESFQNINSTVDSNYDNRRPLHVGESELKLNKKVRSCAGFSLKSTKPSLPYSIPRLEKQSSYLESSRSQLIDSSAEAEPSLITRTLPKPVQADKRDVRRQKEAINTTSKRAFAREFVDNNCLSPAVLKRMNENRRLVQLEPIGNSLSKEGLYQNEPTKKGVASNVDSRTYVKGNQKQIEVGAGRESCRTFRARNGKDIRSSQIPRNVPGIGGREGRPPLQKVYETTRCDSDLIEQRKKNFEFPTLKKTGNDSQCQLPKLNRSRRNFDDDEEIFTPPPPVQLQPDRTISRTLRPPNPVSNRGRIIGYPNKRKPQKEPNPTLLDYQEFSARCKQNSLQNTARRRREQNIPSESSSSDNLHRLPYRQEDSARRRRRIQLPRDWSPAIPSELDIRNAPVGENYDNYKYTSKESERRKLQRFHDFVNSNQSSNKSLKKNTYDDLTSDDSQFIEPPQNNSHIAGKNFNGRGSESTLGRIKKSTDAGTGAFANPYYPSPQGRIRVSKPSLLRSTPPVRGSGRVTLLQPPPHLRHAEGPLSMASGRAAPKFQRETVTKKKYSFLHEKEDFTLFSTKKSKLK